MKKGRSGGNIQKSDFPGDKERAYREKRMLATVKRLLEREDITLERICSIWGWILLLCAVSCGV